MQLARGFDSLKRTAGFCRSNRSGTLGLNLKSGFEIEVRSFRPQGGKLHSWIAWFHSALLIIGFAPALGAVFAEFKEEPLESAWPGLIWPAQDSISSHFSSHSSNHTSNHVSSQINPESRRSTSTSTSTSTSFPMADPQWWELPAVPDSVLPWGNLARQPKQMRSLLASERASSGQPWSWEILPTGLLYRSYLAGEKEPRIGWSSLYDFNQERTVWETALGGRVGLLRYGTCDTPNPQGFQLDAEGAVFTRLLPSEPSTMMEAADFRFGFLGTFRKNHIAFKAGYYHISSHLGDEFLIANPAFPRINYVRDAAIVGVFGDVTPNLQAYGEVANAIGREGGAEPWEFQTGCQFCPKPTRGLRGAPFAGINSYVRQDFNWVTSINVIVGWNWVGPSSGRRFRIGMQYYNGPALQYSFLDRRERLLGGGLWFDY
jgi:hypothetical protein